MVFFRVDANDEIAFGHVMRCLSLADAFRASGEAVRFIAADGNAREVVEGRGFPLDTLGTDWRSLESEVKPMRELLSGAENPLVIVDTYRITCQYVESLADVARICYLGSKSGYLGPLFALVNYSTDIDEASYRALYGGDGTKLMLGPAYAPLRSEFQGRDVCLRPEARRCLVTTGSTDPQNMVGTLLDASFTDERLAGLTFDVVVGPRFASRDVLFKCFSDESHVILHEGVKSMSALMEDCDVALSANGTTVYELAAMGLPAVTFAMVEEQEASAKALASLGAFRYAGSSYRNRKDMTRAAIDHLAALAMDYDAREKLAQRAHELIDGNGCSRIVSELLD